MHGTAKRAAHSGPLSRALMWLGSRELAVLFTLFAVLAAIWGFVEIGEEVGEGSTRAFDHMILLAMRNPADLTDPLGPRWLEEIGRDLTALGGTAVLSLLTLSTMGFLLLAGRRRVALVVLIATVGALGVSTLLKQAYNRDRPELVPHGSVVYTKSFPSGHSMLAASTYLTLAALLMRVQRRRRIKAFILIVAVVTTLLVGISRVYLGVHWPTDVLAGWTAGAGWALCCWLLARWLQQHGQLENDSDTPPDNAT